MKTSPPKTKRALISSMLLGLCMAFCLAIPPGCSKSPPVPKEEAKTFDEYWQAVVTDLMKFRKQADQPTLDAKEISSVRDNVRANIVKMRDTAQEPYQTDFFDIASSHVDNLLAQLDRAASAAQRGNRDEVEKAAMEAGFILDEMNKLLKLAAV
jgi:hypothetical protein